MWYLVNHNLCFSVSACIFTAIPPSAMGKQGQEHLPSFPPRPPFPQPSRLRRWIGLGSTRWDSAPPLTACSAPPRAFRPSRPTALHGATNEKLRGPPPSVFLWSLFLPPGIADADGPPWTPRTPRSDRGNRSAMSSNCPTVTIDCTKHATRTTQCILLLTRIL